MVWANSGYSYKKQITINHDFVVSDETNFPILISITDPNLADTSNGGHVESTLGYDICFYDSTETTLLNHEIESYTNTNGKLIFWVCIPSISSTSDIILYIYYGKTGVIVNPSTTSTWDTSFVGVWHLKDITTSTINDSTSLSNNGTKPLGADNPLEDTGKIGKSQYFYNNYISMGNPASLDITSNKITISAWVKLFELDGDHRIVNLPKSGTDGTLKYTLLSSGSPNHFLQFVVVTDISGGVTAQVITSDTTNFNYVVGVYDGVNVSIYVNGILEQSTPCNGNITAWTTGDFRLGSFSDTYTQYFYGNIDETRVSNTNRSDGWLETSYNTENDPSTFVSFGSEISNKKYIICVGNKMIIQNVGTTKNLVV